MCAISIGKPILDFLFAYYAALKSQVNETNTSYCVRECVPVQIQNWNIEREQAQMTKRNESERHIR